MLLMGKSTISMAIFDSFLYVYQRVVWIDPNLPTNPKVASPRGHRQRRRQGGDQWEVHSCRAGDGSLAGGIQKGIFHKDFIGN